MVMERYGRWKISGRMACGLRVYLSSISRGHFTSETGDYTQLPSSSLSLPLHSAAEQQNSKDPKAASLARCDADASAALCFSLYSLSSARFSCTI